MWRRGNKKPRDCETRSPENDISELRNPFLSLSTLARTRTSPYVSHTAYHIRGPDTAQRRKRRDDMFAKNWFHATKSSPQVCLANRPTQRPTHTAVSAACIIDNEPGSTASVEKEVLQQAAQSYRNGRGSYSGMRVKAGWQVRAHKPLLAATPM